MWIMLIFRRPLAITWQMTTLHDCITTALSNTNFYLIWYFHLSPPFLLLLLSLSLSLSLPFFHSGWWRHSLVQSDPPPAVEGDPLTVEESFSPQPSKIHGQSQSSPRNVPEVASTHHLTALCNIHIRGLFCIYVQCKWQSVLQTPVVGRHVIWDNIIIIHNPTFTW